MGLRVKMSVSGLRNLRYMLSTLEDSIRLYFIRQIVKDLAKLRGWYVDAGSRFV